MLVLEYLINSNRRYKFKGPVVNWPFFYASVLKLSYGTKPGTI